MPVLNGFLITVRTAKQGAAMELGKHSDGYIAETAMLTLSSADLERLELGEEKKAVLKSNSGEEVVTCRGAEGPDGVFFLPLGPVANALIGEETGGTGVPCYKGLEVELRPL